MFPIGLFSNRPLIGGVVTMALLQLAFTYLAPMHMLFHTSEFAAIKWLWVIGVGLGVYLLVETEKLIRRRIESS